MAQVPKKESENSLTPIQWNKVTERTLSLASEITKLKESSEINEPHTKALQKEARA